MLGLRQQTECLYKPRGLCDQFGAKNGRIRNLDPESFFRSGSRSTVGLFLTFHVDGIERPVLNAS